MKVISGAPVGMSRIVEGAPMYVQFFGLDRGQTEGLEPLLPNRDALQGPAA
ncbi:hypothetical protein [Streptomyces sp. NPDC048527]|uniref:hypothetical protein n=1 Tax=Streptomyces sp. NPDC048527 TaxID=3365568 RepID=UPI0037234510